MTRLTVQSRKCVVTPRQHSLLVGVPSRRWWMSGRREAARKQSETKRSVCCLHETFVTSVVAACVKRRRATTNCTDGMVTTQPREIVQSIGLEPAGISTFRWEMGCWEQTRIQPSTMLSSAPEDHDICPEQCGNVEDKRAVEAWHREQHRGKAEGRPRQPPLVLKERRGWSKRGQNQSWAGNEENQNSRRQLQKNGGTVVGYDIIPAQKASRRRYVARQASL